MTPGAAWARGNIRPLLPDKEPFWQKFGAPEGYYGDLNKVVIPDGNTIGQFQLQRLKLIESAVLADKQEHFNPNAYGNMQQVIDKFDEEENRVLSEVITNFVSKANSLLFFTNKEGYAERTWRSINTRLSNLYNALMALSNELNMNGNVVMKKTLEDVEAAMRAADLSVKDPMALRELTMRLNQIKGEVVEEAGVAWLKKLGVANVETIRTGNISLRTTGENGRHSGQIIQDIITMVVDSPAIWDTPITYKPIGGNDFITTTLKEFIDHVEATSGSSEQIILNDEGYTALLGLNQISIQAKAGLKQPLWNKAKYNKVSIGEYPYDDGLSLSVHRTFELLHSLDLEDPKDDWVVDADGEYNALANYGLGTVIAKILHLSELEGNQYVLTPAGFTTFSQRMEQLMREQHFIMKIHQQVTINDNTLGTKYDVDFDKA